MDFIDPKLEEYCMANSSPEAGYLSDLKRETHLKVLRPRMLSGSLQGRYLSMMSKMQKPKRILEIGTYTGFSALCLAEGLQEGGLLYTIEIDEELEDRANSFIEKAGFSDSIKLIIGDAKQIIPSLNETWDLVFIDADKKNYDIYFDLVIENISPGGIIISDNVLWSGKVIDEVKENDLSTKGLLAFNKKVTQDPRVDNVLLPLRDGIMVCRKK